MPGVMPLLWAMCAGVPVIAEASEAVRDIIDDGLSGMLVEQHDVNAAADRVCRLMDDPTVAGRIGMQGRAMTERRYHVSAFCVRLKELYERHLEDRPVKVVSEENADLIEVQRSDAGGVQWVQHV
jgi:glycosyltransferase involved in cell wall biosynthesis